MFLVNIWVCRHHQPFTSRSIKYTHISNHKNRKFDGQVVLLSFQAKRREDKQIRRKTKQKQKERRKNPLYFIVCWNICATWNRMIFFFLEIFLFLRLNLIDSKLCVSACVRQYKIQNKWKKSENIFKWFVCWLNSSVPKYIVRKWMKFSVNKINIKWDTQLTEKKRNNSILCNKNLRREFCKCVNLFVEFIKKKNANSIHWINTARKL